MTKDPVTRRRLLQRRRLHRLPLLRRRLPLPRPAIPIRHANPKIAKCQFCKEQLAKGDIPACAKVCPTGATLFGSYKALTAEIERRKAMKPGETNVFPRRTVDSATRMSAPPPNYIDEVYGEKMLGGTQVRYLSGVPFDKFGLPVGLAGAVLRRGIGNHAAQRSMAA